MHSRLSAHAQMRRRTRHICLKEVMAALNKGWPCGCAGVSNKVACNGLKVVVTADALVLTVDRVKSAQKRHKRRRTHATRVWA